jgi:Iron-binding zinc finger CDGSH type.
MSDTEPKIADTKPAVLELEPGTYYWCACGLSDKQPFCSGAHKGTGISPIKFDVITKQKVALCQCKRSANGVLCDGSHKKLNG